MKSTGDPIAEEPRPGCELEPSSFRRRPAHDGTDHPRQFHFSSGVGDWRVAAGGACAYFRTGSFAIGARFVQAVSELPGLDDHAPDIDLRPDGVFVRLFTTAPLRTGSAAATSRWPSSSPLPRSSSD